MATARKRPRNPNIDLGRMASNLVDSQKPEQPQHKEEEQQQQPTESAPMPPDEEPVVTTKHAGGRPKNTIPTTKMVVYLTRENAKRVKHYAVEHETQYSKVIDALVTKYLDELDM